MIKIGPTDIWKNILLSKKKVAGFKKKGQIFSYSNLKTKGTSMQLQIYSSPKATVVVGDIAMSWLLFVNEIDDFILIFLCHNLFKVLYSKTMVTRLNFINH